VLGDEGFEHLHFDRLGRTGAARLPIVISPWWICVASSTCTGK
jgi:hypothetical protein